MNIVRGYLNAIPWGRLMCSSVSRMSGRRHIALLFRYLQERARSGEDSPVGKPVNQRTDLAGEPVTLNSCPSSADRVLGISYRDAANVL